MWLEVSNRLFVSNQKHFSHMAVATDEFPDNSGMLYDSISIL